MCDLVFFFVLPVFFFVMLVFFFVMLVFFSVEGLSRDWAPFGAGLSYPES